MIFQEKKVEEGWEYKINDVFGVMDFYCDEKIPVDVLDDMVLLLLRQNLSAHVVKGEVKTDQGIVRYTFTKEPQWGDVSPEEEAEWDDPEDKDICENTPTSIPERESVFTPIYLYVKRILRKLRRSGEVLRTIWKNPEA
jgi:hypothetical protein